MKTVPTSMGISFAFIYFGFTALFSWNAFLNCGGFYREAFSHVNVDLAIICYSGAMCVAVLGMAFFGNRLTNAIKCISGCSVLAAAMFAFGIAAMCNGKKGEGNGWSLPLAAVFLGLGSSLVQGLFIGLAGQHSIGSIGKVSVGQALSGLISLPLWLIYNAIAKGILGDSDLAVTQMATVLFMFTASVATIGTIPVYFKLIASDPFFQALERKSDNVADSEQGGVSEKPRNFFAICKDVMGMSSMIWFHFFILFLVFPTEVVVWGTDEITKMKDNALNYFFFAFNLADFVGRYSTNWFKLPPKGVFILSASRIPLFLLMSLASYGRADLLLNDTARMMILMVFTAMQGFVVTWAFIHAPRKLKIAGEFQIAGSISTFMLVFGIFTGTLLTTHFTGLAKRIL
jgi:Nucleoside transporter